MPVAEPLMNRARPPVRGHPRTSSGRSPKTLYRTSLRGRAVRKDKHFEEDVSLVEERVVLFKARSFDEAIRRAEVEGHAYAARRPHANRYGQRVEMTFLEACDAFRLFEQPGHGREVYSRTEVIREKVSDAAVIDQLLGADEDEQSEAQREMFVPG